MMCPDDQLYVAVLYDKWIYHARKAFWWASRYQAIPGCPEVIIDYQLSKAETHLKHAWDLGVHCGILTEELRLWHAWREEEARLAAEGDDSPDDYELTDEDKALLPSRADDFVGRMTEVHERFTKLGQERSAKR